MKVAWHEVPGQREGWRPRPGGTADPVDPPWPPLRGELLAQPGYSGQSTHFVLQAVVNNSIHMCCVHSGQSTIIVSMANLFLPKRSLRLQHKGARADVEPRYQRAPVALYGWH